MYTERSQESRFHDSADSWECVGSVMQMADPAQKAASPFLTGRPALHALKAPLSCKRSFIAPVAGQRDDALCPAPRCHFPEANLKQHTRTNLGWPHADNNHPVNNCMLVIGDDTIRYNAVRYSGKENSECWDEHMEKKATPLTHLFSSRSLSTYLSFTLPLSVYPHLSLSLLPSLSPPLSTSLAVSPSLSSPCISPSPNLVSFPLSTKSSHLCVSWELLRKNQDSIIAVLVERFGFEAGCPPTVIGIWHSAQYESLQI